MTACCLWIGVLASDARRQRLAVEKLQSLNASVRYSKRPEDLHVPLWLREWMGNDYFITAEEVALYDLEVGGKRIPLPPGGLDLAVAAMSSLPHVRKITFNNLRLDEDELKRLAPLKFQLESISINDPWGHFTGAGLRHLAEWPRLKDLELLAGITQSKLLEHLKELPALESLCVTGSLDDAAFAEIARCRRLKRLTLFACSFDGRSLAKLHAIKTLTELSLHNCTPHGDAPENWYFQPSDMIGSWDRSFPIGRYRKWLDAILPGVEIYNTESSN